MDNKFSYAVVGAFVLALGAVLIVGVLWLAAGGTGKKRYEPYEAIFKESVSGLNLNAPVKYLGVDVGKVREIQLDPRNPQQVHLRLEIERGTPVKRDTEAVLRTQGLTGIAYVELSGGSPDSPPLEAPPDGGLPTIPSKPSLATRIENVLTTVLGNIDRTAVEPELDPRRREPRRVQGDARRRLRTRARARGAARGDGGRHRRRRTDDREHRAGERRARAADGAHRRQRRRDREDGRRSAARRATVDRAGAAVGRAADTAASGVRQINAETLPELERLMAELDSLAASLRRLADQTERDPSSLILGPRNLAPGPGEKARP